MISEKIERSNEKTSEPLRLMKEDIETLNDKIEYNQDTLQQQLMEYREELKQTVMEMEEKLSLIHI